MRGARAPSSNGSTIVALVIVLVAALLTTVTPSVATAAPATVEARVASSADDAEENTSGRVDLTSTDLELNEQGGSPQVVGIRFRGLDVPAGAVVTAAWVQFTVDETNTLDTALDLRAQASADAGAFSDGDGDVSDRPVTTAGATWAPPHWTTVGEAGADQRTPDLSAVVQEVVGQPGWAPGNAIALIIDGSGERTAESFDGDAGSAPLLHIEYTDAGNAPPTVEVTDPADGSSLPDDRDVTFSATAADAEDGDLSAAVAWSSDRQGDLGSGADLSTRLSLGTHVVTATVADSAGVRASDSVTVTVTAADPVLVGAGDIARCDREYDTATAELVLDLPDATVFTAGDNAYTDGSPEEFAECYDPTWGQFRDRTRPSVGNHEYRTPDAAGYFGYFGARAGDPTTGYYSYDLGTWHVVVLNSNCNEVGGCDRDDPQGQWLAADLAASGASCTVAYWHHPRFSSGESHGSDADYVDFWEMLDEAGASLVLGGHDHHYERFAPQDAAGAADPDGMRQFVVGTGGTSLNPMGEIQPNSEFVNNSLHGVLVLALRDGSYDWEFRAIPDGAVLDAGSEPCGAGPPDPPPTDEPPVVSISSPPDGATFSETEWVTFAGAADDAEDGDLGASLTWTSSIDGPLGEGAQVRTDGLSVGTHVVTAGVTDSGGTTTSATVAVTVAAGPPPDNGLAQTAVRVRADDSVPLDADSAWAAPPDAAADADMEQRFRVRFEVAETWGDPFTGRFALEYRRNGGPWSGMPVVRDDGTEHAVDEVEIWHSTEYAGGDATRDLLSGSTSPYVGGVGVEDDLSPTVSLDAQHTELEWTVKIRKFHDAGVNAAGDVFEFRVVQDGGAPLGRYAATAAVTLVHPPGLIGGTHVENPQRLGPYTDSNGNLYYVAEPTEFTPRMMMLKSSDGGATWLEVDGANRPVTDDLESVDVRQVGDTLHIAHQPGGFVVYHSFRMSDNPSGPDAWDVRDEVVDSGFDEVDQATAMEVLSDGRIRVFYEATDGSEAILYRTRSTAGAWGAATRLDDEDVDWHWVTTVRVDAGSNPDRIFVFYSEDDGGRAFMRTLDADGTLSSRTQIATLATGADHRQPILPPVSWEEDGQERVLVAYKKRGDTLHSRLISGTAVGPERQAADQPVDRNRGASRQPVADLVTHGDSAHLLYADAATFDLWADATGPGDGTWGTDEEVIDDVRVNWVRGSVFARPPSDGGATVYGFAYEDHDAATAGYATGYIRYAELPLDGAPPPPPPPPDPQPPAADAGPDQTVVDDDGDGSEQVVLDGSASAPGDDPIATYEWYEAGAPVASGVDPTVDLDVGSHVLTLRVTDTAGLADTDTVTVTVETSPQPPPDPVYYLSFTSNESVPGVGVTVRDEDIVAYDTGTASWSMYFDASDVGIASSDLDAFHVRADGSVLMSFSSSNFTVPGLTGGPDGDKVDDSDVFLFTPTSTGETTDGTFSFVLDGSDVGLAGLDEDVDALHEFPDGSLGISTVGTLDVAGVPDGGNADVHRLTGSFGEETTGTWSVHFDGGDVGLTGRDDDVDAITFAGDDLLFSTTGPNSATDASRGDINRFTGAYGPQTGGTISLEHALSALGLDDAIDVDGLHRSG